MMLYQKQIIKAVKLDIKYSVLRVHLKLSLHLKKETFPDSKIC